MLEHKPYIIYLAGGMTGLSKEVATTWRKQFKTLFYEALFKYKKDHSATILPSPYIIIDPSETFFPSKDCDIIYEKEAFNYETYWVTQANAIVVSLDTLSSIGTAQELMLAKTKNKTIFGFVENDKYNKLHPWNKMMCNYIKVYNTPEQQSALQCLVLTQEDIPKLALKRILEEIIDKIIFTSQY